MNSNSIFVLSIISVFELVSGRYSYKSQWPPTFVKQPPNEELLFQAGATSGFEDNPLVIECEAKGEPAPTYRWTKNGEYFNWQNYNDRFAQLSGRGSLLIKTYREEDTGLYQCFAENEVGIASSNSVFLRNVELNPFKDEQTKVVVANEGEPIKFSCQVPKSSPPPDVYWVVQNRSLNTLYNNSRLTFDPEGNLWFSNVTKEDESFKSVYACVVESRFRHETKLGNRIILKVNELRRNTTEKNSVSPVLQYVSRGKEVAVRSKNVELYCIFGGSPLPDIRWFRNGYPLTWSNRIWQRNYGKVLRIDHIIEEDEGDYTCEVSNGVGEPKSHTISLKILVKPFFIEEPRNIDAVEGKAAELHCRASGVPEPQIEWIYNGLPISDAPPNSRRKISNNSIVFEKMESRDIGNYGCNATNFLGYVYKDVYVNF